MKKILIVSLLIPLFLISCGKAEEVKTVVNPPVVEKQTVATPPIVENPVVVTGSVVGKNDLIAERNARSLEERIRLQKNLSESWTISSQSWINIQISSKNPFQTSIENKFKEKWIQLNYSTDYIDKNIDLESLVLIDVSFIKDKNSVYFYGEKIEWADPTTFEVMTNWYSKDKNNIYYIGYGNDFKKTENIDINSFKLITTNWLTYWKDNNWIYYDWIKLKWADPSTFEYHDWYAKDKNSMYLLQSFETARFFDIYRDKELTKYKLIDKDTFESLWEWYYKDKNNIYFIAKYNVWDSQGIIKWADPKTFQVLSKWKAKDKNNTYLLGEITK